MDWKLAVDDADPVPCREPPRFIARNGQLSLGLVTDRPLPATFRFKLGLDTGPWYVGVGTVVETALEGASGPDYFTSTVVPVGRWRRIFPASEAEGQR